jgi:hypothetical protein
LPCSTTIPVSTKPNFTQIAIDWRENC